MKRFARYMMGIILLLNGFVLPAFGQFSASQRTRMRGYDGLTLGQQKRLVEELADVWKASSWGDPILTDVDAQTVLQKAYQNAAARYIAFHTTLSISSYPYCCGDLKLFRAAVGNFPGTTRNAVTFCKAKNLWGKHNSNAHYDEGEYVIPTDAIDGLFDDSNPAFWHEIQHTLLGDAGFGISPAAGAALELNERNKVAPGTESFECNPADDPPKSIGFHHPFINGIGRNGVEACAVLEKFEKAVRDADEQESILQARGVTLTPADTMQLWAPAWQLFNLFHTKWQRTLVTDYDSGTKIYPAIPKTMRTRYEQLTGIRIPDAKDVVQAYLKGAITDTAPDGGVYTYIPPKWVCCTNPALVPMHIDVAQKSVTNLPNGNRRYTFEMQPRLRMSAAQLATRKKKFKQSNKAYYPETGTFTLSMEQAHPQAKCSLEKMEIGDSAGSYSPVTPTLPTLMQHTFDSQHTYRFTYEADAQEPLPDPKQPVTIRLFYEDYAHASPLLPKEKKKLFATAQTYIFIDWKTAKAAAPPPQKKSAIDPPSAPIQTTPPNTVPTSPTQPGWPPCNQPATRSHTITRDLFYPPQWWTMTSALANCPNLKLPKFDLAIEIGSTGISGTIDPSTPDYAQLETVKKQMEHPMAQAEKQMRDYYKAQGYDPKLMDKAIKSSLRLMRGFIQKVDLLDTGYQTNGCEVTLWACLQPSKTSIKFPVQFADYDQQGNTVLRSYQARVILTGYRFLCNDGTGTVFADKGNTASWIPGSETSTTPQTPELGLSLLLTYTLRLCDPATGNLSNQSGAPLEWPGTTQINIGWMYYVFPATADVTIEERDDEIPPEWNDEPVTTTQTNTPPPVIFPRKHHAALKTITLPPLSYRVPPNTHEQRTSSNEIHSCFQSDCPALFGALVSTNIWTELPRNIDTHSVQVIQLDNEQLNLFSFATNGFYYRAYVYERYVWDHNDQQQKQLAFYHACSTDWCEKMQGRFALVLDSAQASTDIRSAANPTGRFEWLSTKKTERVPDIHQLQQRFWPLVQRIRNGTATEQERKEAESLAQQLCTLAPNDKAIQKACTIIYGSWESKKYISR